MKKHENRILVYILMFSAIFFVGCSAQKSAELGQKSYNAIISGFMYSDIFSGLGSVVFDTSGIVRESFGLYSISDNDMIFSDIRIGMIQDTDGSQKLSSLTFSGSLKDKKSHDVFIGDSTIHYIKTDESSYIKWEEGSISLGEGNAESFILSMIINNIHGQWMLIDDNTFINENYFSLAIVQDIVPVIASMQILFRQDLFTITDNSIGGIYPLTLVADNIYIQNLYRSIGIPYVEGSISFQGYIETQTKPRLVIQKLHDSTNEFSLEGYIGIRHGQIQFKNNDSFRGFNREEKKNGINIHITYNKNDSKVWEINSKLSKEHLSGSLVSIAYDGTIAMRFPGQINKQGLITFPIAGLYSISIVENKIFSSPYRYILMSQLFGDAYGILSLLESD